MYESHHEPVIPCPLFLKRMLRHTSIVLCFIAVSLFAGVCGYHYIEGMDWVDALLNASMIAGGMGPVDAMHTVAGKIFASIYAIYSGIFLIAASGFLLTPFFHRVMHTFARANLTDKK